MKVEIQEEWYSIKQCKDNPNKIYVFGDNLEKRGKGGQAIIRNCPNVFGVPTKRAPKNDEKSFFSDQWDEEQSLRSCLSLLLLLRDHKNSKYDTIVFPADGLGTGLAQMDKRSPRLFNMLNDIIKEEFKLKLYPIKRD